MPDASPVKPDRSLAIDAVKGVGILEVVLHHTLGQSATLFSEKGDPSWLLMRSIAWATNFAIPLFLLVTAILLTGSLRKAPPLGEWTWRRVSRTLWPYLLWTVVYWLLRARLDPALLINYPRLGFELVLGKAGIHLYFMVILLQFTVAVPFVYAAMRSLSLGRGRAGVSGTSSLTFGHVLLLSALLQEACFLLQKYVVKASFPADYLTWYVPSLILGVWIAHEPEGWREAWRRWWPAMFGVAAAGCALFAWMSVDYDLKHPTLAGILGKAAPVWESPIYNWASVLFRTGASLVLVGAAGALAATKAGPILAAFGRYSLPIYLVHPAILKLMGTRHFTPFFASLPAPSLWTLALLLALSYGFAWVCARLRIDMLLFGQTLPKPAQSL